MNMKVFIVSLVLFLMPLVNFAHGHEGHGYQHQVGQLMRVGQANCGLGTQIWFLDRDRDGDVDECAEIVFNHGLVHVKLMEAIDGTCTCPTGGI